MSTEPPNSRRSPRDPKETMSKPMHKASGRLFEAEESPAARLEGAYTANIDGAARGNPGPAAYGVVVRGPDGTPCESLGRYIGRQTNNVAEYYALIAALDYAATKGIRRLRVLSDSQLIVNQMKGLFKVKHAGLRHLHERAKKQAAGLEGFSIQYVPREENREADDLANAALDGARGMKPSAAQENRSDARPPARRKIRAHFRGGVLVPDEPLGYAENEVLEIIIERKYGR